jgi:hypothetical protein
MTTTRDIGRKGQISDPLLVGKDVLAIRKSDFDKLDERDKMKIETKTQYHLGKDSTSSDGWIYVTENTSVLKIDQSHLTGDSLNDVMDSTVQHVSPKTLRDMETAMKGGKDKLKQYIADKYYDGDITKDQSVYPVVVGTKVVAVKKVMPQNKTDGFEADLLNVMSAEILDKNTQATRNFIYKKFMESSDMISKSYPTKNAEDVFLARLKSSLTSGNKEVDLDLVFISDDTILFNEGPADIIFSSADFRKSYTLLTREDKSLMPDEFKNETYIRTDMYNNLISKRQDLGIQALNADTENAKLARKGLNMAANSMKIFTNLVAKTSPDTQINNLVANALAVYQYTGTMNLSNMYKRTKDNYEFLGMMQKVEEARLTGDKDYAKLNSELKNHPTFEYYEEGFMSTMVDGIQLDGRIESNVWYRDIGNLANEFMKRNGHSDSKASKFGKKLVKNFFFADGSRTNRIASNTMRLADLAPRQIVYDHIKKNLVDEGMKSMDSKLSQADKKAYIEALEKSSETEAFTTAMGAFVNPRGKNGKIVSSLNSYAIPFSNWFVQFAPAAYRGIMQNKDRTAMLGLMIAMYQLDNDNPSFATKSIFSAAALLNPPEPHFGVDGVPNVISTIVGAVTPTDTSSLK